MSSADAAEANSGGTLSTTYNKTSAGGAFVITLNPDGSLTERRQDGDPSEAWPGTWCRLDGGKIETAIGGYVCTLEEEAERYTNWALKGVTRRRFVGWETLDGAPHGRVTMLYHGPIASGATP